LTREGFIRSLRLRPAVDGDPPRAGYPWELPVVAALARPDRLARGLELNPGVTYLVGENASGKSTLLEALALAAGMNADGGSSNAGPPPLAPYGGRSLHEQSHGESFLAVILNRFGPNGLYLLDEPEAALSTQNCLTCLRRIHGFLDGRERFLERLFAP
jgi:predicted ATPase